MNGPLAERRERNRACPDVMSISSTGVVTQNYELCKDFIRKIVRSEDAHFEALRTLRLSVPIPGAWQTTPVIAADPQM
jgi:hypothetical protein